MNGVKFAGSNSGAAGHASRGGSDGCSRGNGDLVAVVAGGSGGGSGSGHLVHSSGSRIACIGCKSCGAGRHRRSD